MLNTIEHLIIREVTVCLLLTGLSEVKLLHIEVLELASNRLTRINTVERNQTKEEQELVEVQSWLTHFALCVIHRFYHGCLIVFILVVGSSEDFCVIEFILAICNRWQSLLHEQLKLLNIEKGWYEIVVSA
jgi:hypothetical protein